MGRNSIAHEEICIAPDPTDEELRKLKLGQGSFEAHRNRDTKCLESEVCVLEIGRCKTIVSHFVDGDSTSTLDPRP